MSIGDKLLKIAENEEKIYEKGKSDEYNRFWDKYQNSGRRNTYRNAFYDTCWTDDIYNPKYLIVCSYPSNDLYSYSKITDTKVDITFTHVGSSNIFRNCTSLKTIRKITVTEDITFASWFSNCPALENITFEGVIGQNLDLSYSPLLSLESLENIVSCLKMLENGVTKTLSIGEENINKLSETQLAIATSKGWTVV